MKLLNEFKNLVKEENYNDAMFLLVENKDQFDPGVYHYNIGTLWARKGELVTARINFEKAKKEGFLNKSLVKNLEMSKEQLGVAYLEEVEDFSSHLYEFGLNTSIFTPIIASSLIIISILSLIRRKTNGLILGVTLVLGALPLMGYYYVQNNYQEVIIKQEIAIRRGPSKIFEETQLALKGMKIIVSKEKNHWFEVIVPKSHSGWIEKPEMEKL